MNRQQRRQSIRNGMSHKQAIDTTIRDEYQRGYVEGVNAFKELTYIMTAYTISYKLGFGNKRLVELMRAIVMNIDSYRTGQLSHNDYITIKDEMSKLGVTVKAV